jgi:uncharacterized protein (DUF736 family)
MTIIGNFTQQDDSYHGSIATLAVKAKLSIVPVEKSVPTAPDFQILHGKTKVGAAWSKTSRAGNSFLSLSFDDPALAAGYFDLVKTASGHALYWKPNRK